MRSLALFSDSTEFGGAEQSLLTLLRGLDRSRWSPTVIHHGAPALGMLVEETVRLGVPSIVVPAMPEGMVGLRRIPGFARLLHDREFDVFHAQLSWPLSSKFPLAAAALSRVPAVLATVHACPDFTMTRPTAVQQRALGHVVGCYMAVSQYLADELYARVPWPRDRVVVIHNGTDVPSERREADPDLRARLAGPEGRPVVLTLARLVPEKGIDVLIEAAEQVPEARFAIAGDGPERAKLAARITELGLGERVALLGWRADPAELLAAADLFVLPTLREALPISLLEALAAGTPIVATRVGGIPEVVSDGRTGLIVAPGSPAALAGAIAGLLADPDRRERFAVAGRAEARTRFSTRVMAAAVADVYDGLLDGGRVAGRSGGGVLR